MGTQSESVTISSLTKTTNIRGALLANTAVVTGLIRANSLSTVGAISAGTQLSVGSDASISGSVAIAGSLMLGMDSPFTIGRKIASTLGNGRTTVLIGQTTGLASSNGGDLVCH